MKMRSLIVPALAAAAMPMAFASTARGDVIIDSFQDRPCIACIHAAYAME